MVDRQVLLERLQRLHDYLDLLREIAEKGAARVLPAELQARTEGMAGFRDLLVHDYLRLDSERVFRLLVEKLPVLDAIARVFEQVVAEPQPK